jgi:hypothetical protein
MMSRSVFASCAASSERTATLAGSVPGAALVTGMLQPRAPRFELFRGGGAKRIGGAEMDGAALLPRARAELRGGGRLAAAVHADEQGHLRLVLDRQRRRNAHELHHFFPQPSLGFFRRAGEAVFPISSFHSVASFTPRSASISSGSQSIRSVAAAKAVDQLIPETHGRVSGRGQP